MNIENEVYEGKKNSIILSRQSIVISIPILIAIMITYYRNDNYNIYFSLVEIYSASLGAALSIIAILRRDSTEGEPYKYIGYGYLLLSGLSFIKVILNNIGIKVDTPIISSMYLTTFLLEYLVIFIGLILSKQRKSLRGSIMTYTFITLAIMLIVNSIFNSEIIKEKNYNISIIITIFFFIIAIFVEVFILRDKHNLSKEGKLHLSVYLFFITCYQILFNIFVNGGADSKFECGIFKYIAYYVMYESLSKFVLNIPYENMKQNLETAQAKQKNLNNILSNRNKLLRETKSVIEKSEKRYSNLLEAIKDGVMIFYFNKLYYINSSAKKIIGCNTEAEIIGKSFYSMVAELLPEEIIRNKFSDNIELIESVCLEENKVYKMGSIKCNSECELYILKIDGRNIIMYIKDISEVNKNYLIRKEFEEYLKEEKLKNEFYSNISHELRTPINLVYSALQLNDVYLSEGNLENINNNNLAIKQNCLRLIRTINNFIDTNKISEGFIKPQLNSYNIVYIVENISLASNKYIKMNKSQLVFDSSEEEIYCKCDREMLERVILNLLSNCVKYGKDGGTVQVNISRGDKYGLIKVINDGYSIDREIQPYIFDKFTKTNKSFNREKEGSGLGLFLCKALIEIQNGTIELKYNTSEVSEFHIKLPISSRAERKSEHVNFSINPLEEKVDIEFSDIYL